METDDLRPRIDQAEIRKLTRPRVVGLLRKVKR
jgi:hypothetical protein